MTIHYVVASAAIVVGGFAGEARAENASAVPPVHVVTPTVSSKLYPDDLPGPQPEIDRSPVPAELPATPAFELLAATAGRHGARELRVHGRGLTGTQLAVEGYVTWIYDCAAELARDNHEASAAEIADAIEATPSLCDAPMFSLGDTRQTSRDGSIWVVDVPRTSKAAPRLAVGDYVVVTGTWAVASPGGEHNASGLLVYRTAARQPPPSAAPIAVAAPAGLPEVAVTSDVPLRPIVDTEVRNASVALLNECNHALAAKRYELAIAQCRAATDAWPDNHLAWSARASAHMARGQWSEAKAAIAHAVALRPDQGMYQLYDGMARYEVELAAREAELRAARLSPDEVAVVPPASALEAARDALLRATKLAPELWRAHYYLGRIYRDLDEARRSAEQLGQAIALHPGYRPAYLALIDLYRRWGYVDQAAAVATLGTRNVAGDTAELWFELAMAHDARHADDQALAALGQALANRPDDASALIQRGEIYLRKGDHASARRDLERVASSSDPRTAVARRVAAQLLESLASRSRVIASAGRQSSRGSKIYRPSEHPYKPWTQDDAKYRFCMH